MRASLLLMSVISGGTLYAGPADSAAVVAAGYESPTPVLIAPGQIITFFIHGIGSSPYSSHPGLHNPSTNVTRGNLSYTRPLSARARRSN